MYNKAFDCRHVPVPELFPAPKVSIPFDFPKRTSGRAWSIWIKSREEDETRSFITTLNTSLLIQTNLLPIIVGFLKTFDYYRKISICNLSRWLRDQSRRPVVFSESTRQPVEEREHVSNETVSVLERNSRADPKNSDRIPLENFPAALSPFPAPESHLLQISISKP